MLVRIWRANGLRDGGCIYKAVRSSFYSIVMLGLVAAVFPLAAGAQGSPDAPATTRGDDAAQSAAPKEQPLLHEYILQTVGPYSVLMAGFTAGIHQGTDNPPEWRQGAAALGKRFGSNIGITAVGNATRLGLGAALKQDTSYHRCGCKGWWPRLRHAGVSPLVARRRSDGGAVFSVPGLLAPYAATMTATYAWYPERYGAKDAFRMGNYNLLGTVGTNIAFEFVPKVVWRALGRFHLNNRRMQE